MICTQVEKDTILRLCMKVEEVLDNNDWPTEEGMDNEQGQSLIRSLTNEVHEYARQS